MSDPLGWPLLDEALSRLLQGHAISEKSLKMVQRLLRRQVETVLAVSTLLGVFGRDPSESLNPSEKLELYIKECVRVVERASKVVVAPKYNEAVPPVIEAPLPPLSPLSPSSDENVFDFNSARQRRFEMKYPSLESNASRRSSSQVVSLMDFLHEAPNSKGPNANSNSDPTRMRKIMLPDAKEEERLTVGIMEREIEGEGSRPAGEPPEAHVGEVSVSVSRRNSIPPEAPEPHGFHHTKQLLEAEQAKRDSASPRESPHHEPNLPAVDPPKLDEPATTSAPHKPQDEPQTTAKPEAVDKAQRPIRPLIKPDEHAPSKMDRYTLMRRMMQRKNTYNKNKLARQASDNVSIGSSDTKHSKQSSNSSSKSLGRAKSAGNLASRSPRSREPSPRTALLRQQRSPRNSEEKPRLDVDERIRLAQQRKQKLAEEKRKKLKEKRLLRERIRNSYNKDQEERHSRGRRSRRKDEARLDEVAEQPHSGRRSFAASHRSSSMPPLVQRDKGRPRSRSEEEPEASNPKPKERKARDLPKVRDPPGRSQSRIPRSSSNIPAPGALKQSESGNSIHSQEGKPSSSFGTLHESALEAQSKRREQA